MNKEFGRIITNLRKSKGLNQKEAAEIFGISQSLLSHYEKGIRECGLSFLDKAADYYEVSVDYLLGRTPNPSAEKMVAEDISEQNSDNVSMKSNTYCLINRKLITSSASIIYSLLAEINNKRLSKYVTDYLSVAEYKMFRSIFSIGSNDSEGVFELDDLSIDSYCTSLLALNNAKISDIARNNKIEGKKLDADILSEKFGDSFTSLHHLIKNAEKALAQNFKL